MSQLPATASQWITGFVFKNHHNHQLDTDLRIRGLEVLSVAELKTLGRVLNLHKDVLIFRPYVKSNANKQLRVDTLRKAFYRNENCSESNTQLLSRLQVDLLQTASENSSYNSSAAVAPRYEFGMPCNNGVDAHNNRKRPAHQMSSARTINNERNNHHYPMMPGSHIYHSYPTPHHPHQLSSSNLPNILQPQCHEANIQNHHQASLSQTLGDFTQQITALSSRYNQSTGGSTAQSLATSLPSPTTASSSDEAQPLTPNELNSLQELHQMGFPDRHEIISGIRNSGKTTSEDIMMWMVRQKEETEEAHKMDEARLRSEELRRQNAEKQEAAAKERIDNANNRQALKEVFGEASWVLQNFNDKLFDLLVNKYKDALVRLLKLEEKARKWYEELPLYYFRDFCKRCNEQKERTDLIQSLKNECDALEVGMYKLEEQQGGVPKLFIKAQDEFSGTIGNGSNKEDPIVVDLD